MNVFEIFGINMTWKYVSISIEKKHLHVLQVFALLQKCSENDTITHSKICYYKEV